MSVHRDREYREKAEEARREAAKAFDEPSRTAWLKGTEEWLRLADNVLLGRWRPEAIEISTPSDELGHWPSN
jgi:hypothetical protein